jgi:hypothetical protein
MTRVIDRTGKKYGRLLVVEKSKEQYGTNGTRWVCLCECGKQVTVGVSKLQSGHTQSCGCLIRDSLVSRNTKHGMCRTKEYEAWCGMKRRCDPTNYKFPTYREKGIKVCDEWLHDFEAFYAYLGSPPENNRKWSVGRIDNNDDYKPGNIRWEQDNTQARNHSRQKNNTSGITGVYLKTDSDGKLYWVAFWNNLNHKKQRKMFSVNKYGYDEAKKLAADYRKLKINELKESGIDYAESHGSKVGE